MMYSFDNDIIQNRPCSPAATCTLLENTHYSMCCLSESVIVADCDNLYIWQLKPIILTLHGCEVFVLVYICVRSAVWTVSVIDTINKCIYLAFLSGGIGTEQSSVHRFAIASLVLINVVIQSLFLFPLRSRYYTTLTRAFNFLPSKPLSPYKFLSFVPFQHCLLFFFSSELKIKLSEMLKLSGSHIFFTHIDNTV